jgi:hypothetical protein
MRNAETIATDLMAALSLEEGEAASPFPVVGIPGKGFVLFSDSVRYFVTVTAEVDRPSYGERILHVQTKLGLDDIAMARLLTTSVGTLNRWKSNVTAPHPMLVPYIVAVLRPHEQD